MISALLFLQGPGPTDCLVAGLCGLQTTVAAIPPGVMFTAIGLVGLGVFGLYRLRSR